MKRRRLLAGGAAAALLAQAGALAQQAGRPYRVGVLLPLAGLAAQPYLSMIRQKLAEQGFVEGRNLHIEVRYVSYSLMEETRELAALKPDALVAGTTILAKPLHLAAPSAPLVFVWVADPVQAGLVQSLARPGGYATGIANRFYELAQKRVELLHDLLPSARRVAVAAGTFDASVRTAFDHARAVADRFRMKLLPVETAVMWTRALEQALADGAEAILLLTPFDIFGMRIVAEEVVALSVGRRVPVVFADVASVELGGLLSYGGDPLSDVRQASDLLVRVLKGEKPADMSVEQASRFQLAVNMKTAKVLGLEIPRSILLRADRVFE